MKNMVAFNPVATPENIVNIPAEIGYTFGVMDDLAADPEKAAEGLERAIVATVEAIASLLK